MKKLPKLLISMLIGIFLFMLAGCFDKADVLTQYENEAGTTAVSEKTKPVVEENIPVDKENKTINDIVYALESNDRVEITYPSFLSRAYSDLNTEIFRTAMLRMELLAEKDALEQDYEIVLMNDEYISILFRGSHSGSAPYPSQYVNCLNWDMQNDKLLLLSDNQKQEIADILPTCIETAGILTEQRDYLAKFETEEYLALVRDEALYMTEEGLFIVLEVPHAVGDYVEISLEAYYPAERFLGNSSKLSQMDIMNMPVMNGKENPYAGYFASPFGDDVIYAKQIAVEKDEAGFESFVFELYLNGVNIAQTELFYPEALDVQWIDKNTALLMHIFLLDKKTGSISTIAGEDMIAKVMDLFAFNDLPVNMNGTKPLLNSVVDSENNCIYYAFSDGENYDYEVYRYDLKKQQWELLFVDAASLTEYSWLEMFCDGEKLYCGSINGYYVIDLANGIVRKTDFVEYLSPDGRYAILADADGWSLTELDSMEVIRDLSAQDALWLDDEYFVFASNSRITFYSVQGKGIVRAKTIEKSSDIDLDYADGVLYYTIRK